MNIYEAAAITTGNGLRSGYHPDIKPARHFCLNPDFPIDLVASMGDGSCRTISNLTLHRPSVYRYHAFRSSKLLEELVVSRQDQPSPCAERFLVRLESAKELIELR